MRRRPRNSKRQHRCKAKKRLTIGSFCSEICSVPSRTARKRQRLPFRFRRARKRQWPPISILYSWERSRERRNGTGGYSRQEELQNQELYETGDAIEGAFVKEILKGKVILSANGRDEILDMSEAAKERPQASAAPPAPMQRRTPVRVVPRPFASVAPRTDATGVPMPPPSSAVKPTERKSGPARVSRPSRQIKSE